MNPHYHVLAGFHGCLPESNDTHTNHTSANWGMSQIVHELRESGNTLNGSIANQYFEVTEKTTALCDYVEVTTCYESDCLNELEE